MYLFQIVAFYSISFHLLKYKPHMLQFHQMYQFGEALHLIWCHLLKEHKLHEFHSEKMT
jgi:hypothetical protein